MNYNFSKTVMGEYCSNLHLFFHEIAAIFLYNIAFNKSTVVALLPYPFQHRCKDQVVKGLGVPLPVPTEWSTGDQAL